MFLIPLLFKVAVLIIEGSESQIFMSPSWILTYYNKIVVTRTLKVETAITRMLRVDLLAW
jgi:hypothetical protein